MHDDPSLLNEPQDESAAQAFARLDGRIAMMARAVEHLAAERVDIDIPDYSSTLVQMNERLTAMTKSLASIAGKPAMQLTPESLATQMNVAAKTARADDQAIVREARQACQEAAKSIHRLIGTMSSRAEQRRRLLWAAGGGIAAGCLLWAILPGAVLRALPARWHMPERMAAHIIGQKDLWNGIHPAAPALS